ncbi:MAG TPA: riboflavin synthase [Candidatus Dormibacteraeota bacterium]|nr:riboflavin synthase [Candidatus Dormibacteraeota bacterium]
MFTGIVGTVGQVVEWRTGHLGVRSELVPGLALGGSVAVNGVCLTVVEVEGETFFADVVPETRSRTNLGLLRAGQRVNLELPLRAEQGLDGHLVQGHVDGTAHVAAVTDVEMGRELDFELPAELAPYVAEKGSIAVDGTSLTVAGVDDSRGTFRVALIPHTLGATIAGQYVPGTLVNVEVDVVARYVARLIRHSAQAGAR